MHIFRLILQHDNITTGGGVGSDFVPSPSNNVHPIKKVAIFGHSYVRYFYIDRQVYHPEFTLCKFAVPGGKVGTIRNTEVWNSLIQYKPDLTIILLGGNDIASNTVPRDLAHSLEGLVLDIEALTGGGTILLGIEHRTIPRGVSADTYRKIRNSVNRWLRAVLPVTKPRFRPIGVRQTELDFDGVHLNPTASEDLFQRIVFLARDYFVEQQGGE